MIASITPDQAAAYELAYREGARALDWQGTVIETYRTRAGVLLSAAAITTSFLGGAALERGPSLIAWLAISAFVLLGVGVVLILWPGQDHRRAARPALMLRSYIEPTPLPLPLIHRDLAHYMDKSFVLTRGHLQRLTTTLRGCSVLLLIETVLWVVDLIAKA